MIRIAALTTTIKIKRDVTLVYLNYSNYLAANRFKPQRFIITETESYTDDNLDFRKSVEPLANYFVAIKQNNTSKN